MRRKLPTDLIVLLQFPDLPILWILLPTTLQVWPLFQNVLSLKVTHGHGHEPQGARSQARSLPRVTSVSGPSAWFIFLNYSSEIPFGYGHVPFEDVAKINTP